MTSIQQVGVSPFDAIRREDEAGEYWTARDLMPLLGYTSWDRVPDVLDRARAAINNSGGQAPDHIRGASKMVPIGSGAERAVMDYRLTRYASYVVAMNGDPRKPEVASAQSYFAIRTREAETSKPTLALDPGNRADLELILTAANAALVSLKDAERKIVELEPKAEAFESFMTADGDYLIATVGNMLGIGQNTLFARLRDEHVLISGGRRHNTPYQQYAHHFRVVARTGESAVGDWVSYTTYVRPSGVDFIRKVLKLQHALPAS